MEFHFVHIPGIYLIQKGVGGYDLFLFERQNLQEEKER